MPLILTFHGGGKKLEDLREIKGEVSLRELLEMENLPVSCTIGDWLRRTGKDGKGLSGLGKVDRHLVREVILRARRNSYTLDVDATVIESEKEEAKVTYKGEKGYQPHMGFLFETGLILEDEFREGNIPAQAEAVNFVEKCFEAMPPGKSITYLRGDECPLSDWGDKPLLRAWYLVHYYCYQDKAVKKSIKAIREWCSYQGDREVGETVHNMNGTKEVFRLIVIRWSKL